MYMQQHQAHQIPVLASIVPSDENSAEAASDATHGTAQASRDCSLLALTWLGLPGRLLLISMGWHRRHRLWNQAGAQLVPLHRLVVIILVVNFPPDQCHRQLSDADSAATAILAGW